MKHKYAHQPGGRLALLPLALVIGCGGGTQQAMDGGRDTVTDLALTPDLAPDAPTPITCDEGLLYASEQRLINVFATADGIIVVQADAVLLVDRDKRVQRMVPSARPITAAAFDGETLAVADAAALIAYSPRLELRTQVLLTRSCASLVLMDGGIAVCNAYGSLGYAYYSYDTRNGTKLAVPMTEYQQMGDKMLRLPGTKDFMTYAAELYLYQVEPDGKVVHVDKSPSAALTGSIVGNQVFAFSTPQATDVINWEGKLFFARGDDCTPVDPFLPKSRCFTANGQLGTLPSPDARYVALATGGSGEVLGLTSAAPDLATRPFIKYPCQTGCMLQKIDYANKRVAYQRQVDITPKTALAMRADTACDMAVFAYQVTGSLPVGAEEWSGFRIDHLHYRPVAVPDGGTADAADGPDAPATDASLADAPSADGRADAVTDAGADGAPDAAPRPSTGCAPYGLLDYGTTALINAFPVPEGIIVVRTNSIALVGRDRIIKKMLTPPAPISSAAIDGQTLVTADTANVNVYSAALVPQGTIPMLDPCWDSIMAPGGIFVCQPDRMHDLIFSSFDVRNVRFMKESPIGSYAGGQVMEGAATTPYFALLSGGSPSSYRLFATDPDGTVRAVNSGATFIENSQNTTFQFAGAPPSHLLTSRGDMLRMLGPGCDGTTAVTSGCLVADGVLGTLLARERFVGLHNDGANLFGFVSHTGSSDTFDEAPCRAGCAVQRLDVTQRAVTAQQTHALDARKILFIRPDPTCNMAAVGYQGQSVSSQPPTFAYKVDLLDYLSGP